MNKDFVIEEQYNNGVGLIEIDETQKLIKHYECKLFEISRYHMYTIDIYENGLIKIYHTISSLWNERYEYPAEEVLNINITNVLALTHAIFYFHNKMLHANDIRKVSNIISCIACVIFVHLKKKRLQLYI